MSVIPFTRFGFRPMAGAALLVFSVSAAARPAPGGGAGQVSGRGFTVEDALGIARVSDPQLSPDGELVAYVEIGRAQV